MLYLRPRLGSLVQELRTSTFRNGAIALTAAAAIGAMGALSAQAQSASPVVQLTKKECLGATGFIGNHLDAEKPDAIGLKFVTSVFYFVQPDGKTSTCDGKPLLDPPICRTAPGVSARSPVEPPQAIKTSFLSSAAFLITPDDKLAICNPGPEDRSGTPTIVVSSLRELAVWKGIEDSGHRTGIKVARAIRLVADPKGDPRLPDLLAKRLKALDTFEKLSDAGPMASPR